VDVFDSVPRVVVEGRGFQLTVSDERTKVIPRFPTERSCLTLLLRESGDGVEAMERRAHDAEDREAASGTAST